MTLPGTPSHVKKVALKKKEKESSLKALWNKVKNEITAPRVIFGSMILYLVIYAIKESLSQKNAFPGTGHGLQPQNPSADGNQPLLLQLTKRQTREVVTLQRGTLVNPQRADDETCGYHAIKNAVALGNDEYRNLLNEHTPINDWREAIIELAQRRNAELAEQGLPRNDPSYHPVDGSDLDQHGIEHIIDEIRADNTSPLPMLRDGDIIEVVTRPEQLQEPDLINQQKLANLRAPGTVRVILQVQAPTRKKGVTAGHWIAVVIRRNEGQVTYEWADSLNNINYHYPELRDLMGVVEGIA